MFTSPHFLVLTSNAAPIENIGNGRYKDIKDKAPKNGLVIAVKRNRRGQKDWLANARCSTENEFAKFVRYNSSYEYLFWSVPVEGDNRYFLPPGAFEVTGHCYAQLYSQIPEKPKKYRLVVVRNVAHGDWFLTQNMNGSYLFGPRSSREKVTYWIVPWQS